MCRDIISCLLVLIDSDIQRVALVTKESIVIHNLAKDLSNVNPARGHKEMRRRSTGHMVGSSHLQRPPSF